MQSIGNVARQAGISVQTVRFYEEKGLMPSPGRTRSGRRAYSSAEIDRLLFIRRARSLGFGLDQIAALLKSPDNPVQQCADADALAERALSEVREKIRDLSKIEASLAGLLSTCQSEGAGACRIIQAVAGK